jgi:spermidine synthase
MAKKTRLAIYSLFFLSGLAGLLYEIVWGRQLVLIFGNTTHSLVAVLSAFFTGLALGSLLIGGIIDRVNDKYLLKLYALLELGAGLLSGLTLVLFPAIKHLYIPLSDGTTTSPQLLLIKFSLTVLSITLPTLCMGATLPILVRIMRSQGKEEHIVSTLYAVNTLGGVTGVFLAGFIFLELFGLTKTVLIGVGTNCGITLIALLLPPIKVGTKLERRKTIPRQNAPHERTLAFVTFFCSGFIAIAYQLLWTRLLIPSLGTLTYAFAAILICYLLGIAIGSFIYKKFSAAMLGSHLTVGLCQIGIAAAAAIPIILNHVIDLKVSEVALRVLPATICMGIAFPALINLVKDKKNIGNTVGLSYFFNTLGSIIGGFVTSFIFMPYIGTPQSILLLALANAALALFFIRKEKQYGQKVLHIFTSITTVICVCILGTLFFVQQGALYPKGTEILRLAAQKNNAQFKIQEDEVASIVGYNDQKLKILMIDGYPTTSDALETRIMAHLPIALHGKPKRVLIIAFGMGTTYRSALKRGLIVDNVELVPSVPSFMSVFHPDAKKWLASPNGRVIINDGRNYALLTKQRYDIVIIDPPPPFYTAGSSVLYTEEFYTDLKRLLNPGGIVSQWLFYDQTRNDDALMAVKSFTNTFPAVSVFRLQNSAPGIFLEGSVRSITNTRAQKMLINPIARGDIRELQPDNKVALPTLQLIAEKRDLLPLLTTVQPVTDDHPGNEYFLLRHLFSHPAILNNNAVQKLFLR